jgi:hypothetical protein
MEDCGGVSGAYMSRNPGGRDKMMEFGYTRMYIFFFFLWTIIEGRSIERISIYLPIYLHVREKVA